MDFASKITKLRKQQGLSQEKLAEKLEVSRQSVFKWESGENTPDIGKIIKLSELFNVSIDALLRDDIDLDEYLANRQNEQKETPKKTLSKNGLTAIIVASIAVIALSVSAAVITPILVLNKNSGSDTISNGKDADNEVIDTVNYPADETSTRSIQLSEINGTWETVDSKYTWTIEDKDGYSSVLTEVVDLSFGTEYPYESATSSSVLYGYGMAIQKKSALLVNGTNFLDKANIDIYLTKNVYGVIKIYYSDYTFIKQ